MEEDVQIDSKSSRRHNCNRTVSFAYLNTNISLRTRARPFLTRLSVATRRTSECIGNAFAFFLTYQSICIRESIGRTESLLGST